VKRDFPVHKEKKKGPLRFKDYMKIREERDNFPMGRRNFHLKRGMVQREEERVIEKGSSVTKTKGYKVYHHSSATFHGKERGEGSVGGERKEPPGVAEAGAEPLDGQKKRGEKKKYTN